jgi:hypothetical protein
MTRRRPTIHSAVDKKIIAMARARFLWSSPKLLPVVARFVDRACPCCSKRRTIGSSVSEFSFSACVEGATLPSGLPDDFTASAAAGAAGDGPDTYR